MKVLAFLVMMLTSIVSTHKNDKLKQRPDRVGRSPLFSASPKRLMGMLDRSWLARASLPEKAQKGLLATAKEGPTALYIPEAVVTGGRSLGAYDRGGWLELQERFTEESVVAGLWLFGVKGLQSFFQKRIEPKLFPNNHVSSDVAWKRPWQKPTSVDLIPQELFASGAKEVNTLLKIKALRWLFSVGTTVGSVAYVVPKLNQWKTNAILSHLSRRTRSQEGDNVQFGDPQYNHTNTVSSISSRQFAPSDPIKPFLSSSVLPVHQAFQPNGISTFPAPVFSQQSSPRFSPFLRRDTLRPEPVHQSSVLLSNHSAVGYTNHGPTFGSSSALSAVQGLGHLVEQTPWGSILVVDAGVASGRGYVASRRSKDETVEVLFRDLGSLYFYILSTPHMMKGISLLTNKALGTYIDIQPKIANALHQRMANQLKKFEAGGTVASPALLKRILLGESPEVLKYGGDTLKQKMRQAKLTDFQQLLKKEMSVFLNDSLLEERLDRLIQARYTQPSITVTQFDGLLQSIQSPEEAALGVLSDAEKSNVVAALKHAFRHSAGVVVPLKKEKLKQLDSLRPAFSHFAGDALNSDEQLVLRTQRMARLDALDRSHTMLRRSFNVARSYNPKLYQELSAYEQLADWMSEALAQRLTLDAFIQKKLAAHDETLAKVPEFKRLTRSISKMSFAELRQVSESLSERLKGMGEKVVSKPDTKALGDVHSTLKSLTRVFPSTEQGFKDTQFSEGIAHALLHMENGVSGKHRSLIQHYRQAIQAMHQGNAGHLFSLDLSARSSQLQEKVSELLRGGIQHDGEFMASAMNMMGYLETNPRKFNDGSKQALMRNHVKQYSQSLVKVLEDLPKNKHLMQTLQRYQKLNQNLHFAGWTAALGTTLVFIGGVIPKLQIELTKWRTGKNVNPGIASAMSHYHSS